jgi:hypothetical protein
MGEKPTQLDEGAESERTNLNSSKSNLQRADAAGGGEEPPPAQGERGAAVNPELHRPEAR